MFASHMLFSRIIVRLKVIPELDKSFHIECFGSNDTLFELKELDELIRLGSIGDHEERYIMNASKDSRVESHPDNRVKSRIDFEGLFQ